MLHTGEKSLGTVEFTARQHFRLFYAVDFSDFVQQIHRHKNKKPLPMRHSLNKHCFILNVYPNFIKRRLQNRFKCFFGGFILYVKFIYTYGVGVHILSFKGYKHPPSVKLFNSHRFHSLPYHTMKNIPSLQVNVFGCKIILSIAKAMEK